MRSTVNDTWDDKNHYPAQVSSRSIPQHGKESCRESWCGVNPPVGYPLGGPPKGDSVQGLMDRQARGEALTEREAHIVARWDEATRRTTEMVNGEALVPTETVNHPAHYGGDTTYETIKVIEAWGLGFRLGNAVKYISRADAKGNDVEDLEKAAWYLNREILRRKGELDADQ